MCKFALHVGDWRVKCLVMLGLGFETTADVHVVPAGAVRQSYGAVDLSTTPSPAAVNELVVGDSDVECDDADYDVAVVDDRPQVGNASIQHSSDIVVVAVDLPAPDQSTI